MADPCYLNVYGPDGSLLGEFADASWTETNADGESTIIFRALASDGAADTFRRLDDAGVDTVTYQVDWGNGSYTGPGRLLSPEKGEDGLRYLRIEALDNPMNR